MEVMVRVDGDVVFNSRAHSFEILFCVPRWRSLFFVKKPVCATGLVHTDGDYIEYNSTAKAWFLRHSRDKSGCTCDGCVDHSTNLPEGKLFLLPDVHEMPSDDID